MSVVAEAPCVATLHGGDDAWRAAVSVVEAKLADCRRVDVSVAGNGAVVVYVARDGRVAVRRIATPDELESTVAALAVAIPEDEAPTPSEKPVVRAEKPAQEAPRPPETLSLSPSVRLALYGGTRIGWPGTFVSPLLGASGVLGLGDWSLGLYGEWELSYSSKSEPLPRGYQLSAVAAGFSIGRRFFDRALLVDFRIGGAVVTEEGSDANAIHGDDRAEARIGIHVHTAIPRPSSVRLRAGIGFEVAPTRLSRGNRFIDPSLPPPPVWALVLTVGFEADASGG